MNEVRPEPEQQEARTADHMKSTEGHNGVPDSVWARLTEEERNVQSALDERAQLAREYTGGEW